MRDIQQCTVLLYLLAVEIGSGRGVSPVHNGEKIIKKFFVSELSQASFWSFFQK